MKAVVTIHPEGRDVLKYQDYPKSEIKQDILIEVKAAGFNRSDIFQGEGNYPAPSGEHRYKGRQNHHS